MDPLKKVASKEQRLMLKPWITKGILDKCNQRDKLLNEMRKENDPIKKRDLRKEYKVFCNRICEEKRQGKRNFNAMKFEKYNKLGM